MARSLNKCIVPWSREDFLKEWWEQRPLIIKRDSIDHFSDLVTLQDFDHIVASTNLRYPYFRLFRDGQLTPPGHTTTSRQLGSDIDRDLANLNVIYDHYCDGGTIVLQAMERWWPPLTAFCRDFEQDLGFPTQAYIYLAPPNAQGPPAHYDTHDVFVLQVDGSKQWHVWGNPKPLPMRMNMDTYDAEAIEAYTCDNEPLHSLMLNPGDSLYLPRGYIHKACAGINGSFHVSISIMVNRWIDALDSLVALALEKCQHVLAYRQSLPFGRFPAQPPDEASKRTFQQLVDGLLAPLELDKGLSMVRQELITYATPSFRGRLKDLEALDQITLNTQIWRRNGIMFRLLDDDQSLLLTFGRTVERFDRQWLEALRFVTSTDAFHVKNIPGELTDDQQISLAKRLIISGFSTLQLPNLVT